MGEQAVIALTERAVAGSGRSLWQTSFINKGQDFMQVVFGCPAADLSRHDKGEFAVRRLPKASGAKGIVL